MIDLPLSSSGLLLFGPQHNGPLGVEQEEEDVSRSRFGWTCFFPFPIWASCVAPSPPLVLCSLRPLSFFVLRLSALAHQLWTQHKHALTISREKTAAPDSGGSLAGLAMVAAAAAALVWWRRRTNAPGPAGGASPSKGKQVRLFCCERGGVQFARKWKERGGGGLKEGVEESWLKRELAGLHEKLSQPFKLF